MLGMRGLVMVEKSTTFPLKRSSGSVPALTTMTTCSLEVPVDFVDPASDDPRDHIYGSMNDAPDVIGLKRGTAYNHRGQA